MSSSVAAFQDWLRNKLSTALSQLSDSAYYREFWRFVLTKLDQVRSSSVFQSISQPSTPQLLGTGCVAAAVILVRFFRRVTAPPPESASHILVLWDWENMGLSNTICSRFGDSWGRAISAFVLKNFGNGRSSSPMKVHTRVYLSSRHPLSDAQRRMLEENGFASEILPYATRTQVADVKMIEALRSIDPATRATLTLVVISHDKVILRAAKDAGVNSLICVVKDTSHFDYCQELPRATAFTSDDFYMQLLRLR